MTARAYLKVVVALALGGSLVMVGAVFLLALMQVGSMTFGDPLGGWVATDGRVIETDFEEFYVEADGVVPEGAEGAHQRLRVYVEYEVDGRVHVSSITLRGYQGEVCAEQNARLEEQWYVGKAVAIRYDPEAPDEVMRCFQERRGCWVKLMLICAVIGIVLVVSLIRLDRMVGILMPGGAVEG